MDPAPPATPAVPSPEAALPAWARERLARLRALVARPLPAPNVACDWDDGAIALEWWAGRARVAIYLLPDGGHDVYWQAHGGPLGEMRAATLELAAERLAWLLTTHGPS